MAQEWYLMDHPPIYNGGYERSEWGHYARQGFQEMLDTTMLGDHVEFINSDFSDIVPGKAVIQSVSENTPLKQEDRQILAPIGILPHFSYVRFKDVIWLIDAEPSDNKFYEKAPLKLCNNVLRWQDRKTKKIKEYWYWAEDITRYGSGLYEGNVVIYYDKQYILHLPHDCNTDKLHVGMRFLLEKSNGMPLVYKLTKFDGITGNNQNVKILKIVLTATVYDETVDNADLMIADYYDKDSQEVDADKTEYYCKILFRNGEIRLLSSEVFEAVFTDVTGKRVHPEFHWEIAVSDFSLDSLKSESKDDMIKISVSNNEELVGKTFLLKAVLSDDTVMASVEVKIVPLW